MGNKIEMAMAFNSLLHTPPPQLEGPFPLTVGSTQFVHFEGANLAFDLRLPEGEVTSLLCLVNGYQRPRREFRGLREKLHQAVEGLATLAIDNRHAGETVVLEEGPLHIHRMARDVWAVGRAATKALGLLRFSVLGISMGGMIAQTLAAVENLEKLFLVSTTPGGAARVWSGEPPTEYKAPRDPVKHLERYVSPRFLKNSEILFRHMAQAMAKSDPSTTEIPPQWEAGRCFDGTAFHEHIKSPTLVICGDDDLITPLGNSVYLKSHIAQAQLAVYPQVGHLILVEAPDRFAKDVSSFLQERK